MDSVDMQFSWLHIALAYYWIINPGVILAGSSVVWGFKSPITVW
jgi:hypothetical protein